MNIAVVGSSGYISGYLIERFEKDCDIEEILKIDCTDKADVKFDLQKPEKFNYDLLTDVDYLIFTAAISGPDRCAADFKFCWSINVTGTIYFISEAVKRGCRVLFFSSDAVFGDISGMIYTEHSETNAITPYGRMKKTVEDHFWQEKNFKAIRLSYVVSAKDRFVSYCLDCISKGDTADIFHPFYRNCISVSDVVEVAQWFANHWEEYPGKVLNVAGRELVSRVRIADEINRYFGGRMIYHISTPDDAFYQNRPKITQMESLYMKKYHIFRDESFTEKIKKELEAIENEY